MLEISLEAFLRTGVFGPFEFGMSRENIEELLGPCERVIETQEIEYRHHFLEYPEVAFSFSPIEAGLTAVRFRQSENESLEYHPAALGIFEGRIELDPWVIRWMTPRAVVEIALREAGIPVWRLESPIPDLVEHIEVGEGRTVLGFDISGEFAGLSIISSEHGPFARPLPRSTSDFYI